MKIDGWPQYMLFPLKLDGISQQSDWHSRPCSALRGNLLLRVVFQHTVTDMVIWSAWGLNHRPPKKKQRDQQTWQLKDVEGTILFYCIYLDVASCKATTRQDSSTLWQLQFRMGIYLKKYKGSLLGLNKETIYRIKALRFPPVHFVLSKFLLNKHVSRWCKYVYRQRSSVYARTSAHLPTASCMPFMWCWPTFIPNTIWKATLYTQAVNT